MKKLTALIILALMTWIVSSAQNTRDTTIILPKNVAREVAKDLTRCDSVANENDILKQDIGLYKQNLSAKDSLLFNSGKIVGLYQARDSNWQKISGLQSQQLSIAQDLNKNLAKDLKREKRKNLTTKVGAGTLVVLLTVLLLKK